MTWLLTYTVSDALAMAVDVPRGTERQIPFSRWDEALRSALNVAAKGYTARKPTVKAVPA